MSTAALPVLRTPRLTLRPLEMSDADAIAEGVGNFDVSRWLSVVPYPYGRDDAAYFIEKTIASAAPVRAICDADGLCGLIGTQEGLGYWLARPAWRRGYAFEAAHAVAAEWFRRPGAGDLPSAVFAGNARSAAILSALGFQHAATVRRPARALSQEIEAEEVVLTQSAWRARAAFELTTPRLRLRPLAVSDAGAMVAMGVPEVARHTGSFQVGWSRADVARYIEARRWRGLSGFMLAVEKDGAFVGVVGCGGKQPAAMYAFLPQFHGRGIATEAMRAFLPELFRRFPFTRLVADHYDDNPASGAVLRKLGFAVTGEDIAKSPARLEPHRVITYAITRGSLGMAS